MGPTLGYCSFLENNDKVGIINGPQTVGNENGGAGFLFENAVDILQKRLLCMCIKRRGLRLFRSMLQSPVIILPLRQKKVVVDPSKLVWILLNAVSRHLTNGS